MVKLLELAVSMITSVPMVQILALQMLLAQIPLVSLDFESSFPYYTKVLLLDGFLNDKKALTFATSFDDGLILTNKQIFQQFFGSLKAHGQI